MKKEMLINAVHPEQKRMAIVDDGRLVEYNIQMASREPITGNVYKGVVMKVERGLQAAFVNYGGKKDGFLPLRDVSPDYFSERRDGGNGGQPRSSLKVGQEILVQVLREVSERKGALLTSYISLPGRYLVLMPKKAGGGISRKIEDEEDRKRLKDLMIQIKVEPEIGFIIRTAGMNRTKQELSRDYQQLTRLWKEIQKRAAATAAPTVIYQESDFGVFTLRDYYTSEIEEIWVDDLETFRMMRAYCKTVMPRNVKIIKHYKDKTPIFDRYGLEDQIRVIYQEKVDLKSGGYLIINPTEAMITIDVNSGRGSNKRNVEETAYRTNLEAAEEIARQLRLRDLGGLIVIDFIDMGERQHNAEVEKVFKKALSVDRARIQLSRISKFGMLELSRQKKQSTIQEISYTTCPHCKGTGLRPALEYIALSAFRKIESQAVKGQSSHMKVTLPYAVSDYLLNQKRSEISRIEAQCEMTIHISGEPDMPWDEVRIQTTERQVHHPSSSGADRMKVARSEPDSDEEAFDEEEMDELAVADDEDAAPTPEVETPQPPTTKKKSRRRSRHKKKKVHDTSEETVSTEAGVPKSPAFSQGLGDDGTERKTEENAVATPVTASTIQEASEAPAAAETPKPAKRPSGRKRTSRSSRSKKAKVEAAGGTADAAESTPPSPTPVQELPDGGRNELLEKLRSVFDRDDE